MYIFDLHDRQVEVDGENHHFVLLQPQDNGEDDKTSEDNEDTEEDEGRDEEPVVQVLALLERPLLEVNELRCGHCCEVSQGVVDYVEGLDQSLVPGLGNLVRAVERQ